MVNSWFADDEAGTIKRVFRADFENFERLKENLSYFLEIMRLIETSGLDKKTTKYGYLRKFKDIYIRAEE